LRDVVLRRRAFDWVVSADAIEHNFLVKGRCGISFAVAPHVSGWSLRQHSALDNTAMPQ